MENQMKQLLQGIREKRVRKFVENHVREVRYDKVKKEFSLYVDKKYSMNTLRSSGYILPLVELAETRFWEWTSVELHVKNGHRSHEREMLIPYAIREEQQRNIQNG
jgi:hypothetical protein